LGREVAAKGQKAVFVGPFGRRKETVVVVELVQNVHIGYLKRKNTFFLNAECGMLNAE
jgi:hypothetical protein